MAPLTGWSGGGPQNVLVVANEKSRESVEIAKYYMNRRGIPARNLLLVRTPRDRENLSVSDFEKQVSQPILEFLQTNALGPQIQYIVICPDLPSRVNEIEGAAAVLYYGFKNAPACPPCTMPENTRNPYFADERAFDWKRLPAEWEGTRRLVTLLRAGSTDALKNAIDRSAAADGVRPSGTFYLHKSPDPNRNVRHLRFGEFDFHARFFTGMPRIVYGSCFQHDDILGFMDGTHQYTTNFWAQVRFIPGALADHMTSLAGRFPSTPPHDPSWIWLDHGAAGSYGTVNEPCNPLQKFPDPMAFFWYARGFNLAESYWMSVANPYQGVFLGDPLTAPFANPPTVRWITPIPPAVVTGTITLQWEAVASDDFHPCASSELYIDDLFVATVTGVQPTVGTEITLSIGRQTVYYMVKPGDTLYSIPRALNMIIRQTPSPIRSEAFGDRLMLLCMDSSVPLQHLAYQIEIHPPPNHESVLTAKALSPFFLRSAYPLDKTKGLEYPRGCVLFACGRPKLVAQYVWDTRTVPNGAHTLRAVVKDGTAVETQGFVLQTVIVSNEVRRFESRAIMD